MLMPFEDGGSVYVGENGRVLVVTTQEILSPVFLEVQAVQRAAHPEFVNYESMAEFLASPSDTAQCEAQVVREREWALCQQADFPGSVVRYLLEQDMVYQVSATSSASVADAELIESMISSLRFLDQ
jgi:hypothetical protein